MVQPPQPRKRMTMGIAAKRGFSLFAMALMLAALVPQSAFAQTPQAPPTEAPATLHVRIEEEVASAYNATSRLSTTATGRIVVNNTENRTLTNVVVRLNSTSATDLPVNNTLTVPSLPPGETVVATYNITTQPRLSLGHEWKSLTYLETVEELFQQGKLSQVGRQIALNPHKLAYGRENLLEFNITVSNTGSKNLTNVTVTDLLPNRTVNGSLVAVSTSSQVPDPYGGVLTYENASDSVTIPLLRSGSSTTLTLRATLPASAFGPAEPRFTDLRREIRAYYTVERTFTQEPTPGRTAEREAEFQSRLLTVLAGEQEQIVRDTDPFELLDFAKTLGTLQELPGTLRQEAFARAAALGIPLDNQTFAAELENQTRARARDVVKPLDDTLNFSRERFGRFITNYGRLAALTFEANRTLQSILAPLNITVNETDRREALQNLSESGFPAEIVQVLHNESLNDTQIEELRQFLLNNSETLANTSLERSLRNLQKTYLSAGGEFLNMSTQVLANRVMLAESLGLRGNLTGAEIQSLHSVRTALNASLQVRNWTQIRDLGKQLMDLGWNYTLRTGDVLFAGVYWKAARFHQAGILGVAGDNASAESLILNLTPESHIYGFLTATSATISGGDPVTIPLRVLTSDLPERSSGLLHLRVVDPDDNVLTEDLICGDFEATQGGVSEACSIPATVSSALFSSVGNYRANVRWLSNHETGAIGQTFLVVVTTPAPPPGGGGGAPSPTPTPFPSPAPTPTPPAGPKVTIRVVVKDASGQSVPNAKLTILDKDGRWSTSGTFFGTVPAGISVDWREALSFFLFCSNRGYDPSMAKVEVAQLQLAPGTSSPVFECKLGSPASPEAGKVPVTVHLPEVITVDTRFLSISTAAVLASGEDVPLIRTPIAGAEVRVFDRQNVLQGRTLTDPNGDALFNLKPNQHYSAEVSQAVIFLDHAWTSLPRGRVEFDVQAIGVGGVAQGLVVNWDQPWVENVKFRLRSATCPLNNAFSALPPEVPAALWGGAQTLNRKWSIQTTLSGLKGFELIKAVKELQATLKPIVAEARSSLNYLGIINAALFGTCTATGGEGKFFGASVDLVQRKAVVPILGEIRW